MKVKDYICACGHDDFMFLKHETHTGIYCAYCGRWLKWADKQEKNLAAYFEKIKENRSI